MRLVLLIAVTVCVLAAQAIPSQGVPSRSEAAKPYGIGTPQFAQLSSASCAAAACHGGGQLDKLGSEHSTWAPTAFDKGQHDPHSRAYRILFNADSLRIGKLLGIAAPHQESLCLKCHAVDGVQPTEAIAEGVGCGACHGPAEKWLTAHYQPEWKTLANRVKWEEYGFVPAENLVARALNCAGCHAGDAEKEVNHDLIAAGHPRLNFELASFNFNPNYRKHWVERIQQPDFEVRAWIVGQVATLRAATDLLRARAERATTHDPKAVWPEFAGLNCFACHQKIGVEVNRIDSPAIARWEVWSNNGIEVAAKSCPEAFLDTIAPRLLEISILKGLMDKPSPNPRAVATQAARAVAELDAWLATIQNAVDCNPQRRISVDSPRRIASRLAEQASGDREWDALASDYLGCAAMYHGQGGRKAVPRWSDPIYKLGAELRFPRGYNSPAAFERDKRERVRDHFTDLFGATGGIREKP